MRQFALGTAVAAFGLASFVLISAALYAQTPVSPPEQMGMGSSGSTDAATPGMADPASGLAIPPVKGYSEGQEIRFIHTEASDPQVAQMLTEMMGSPVLIVPSLAEAPDTMLAAVYVFTNGISGEGPFGYQADVFDNPPGTEGYSPLRAVHLVSWANEDAARELRSGADVRDAEASGAVSIQRAGAVVNMPFLNWTGGHR